MPELPEVTVYLHALRPRILGERIERVRIASPSLLKTFDPTPAELHGKRVETLSRLGKQIVLGLEEDLFAVIHLMIAGRFQWRKPGAAVPRKRGHAAFDFARGTRTRSCSGPVCRRCRIVYANRETNYCPACQTGGRLLADRALSRLLGRDWPKTVEELEELRRAPEPES